MIHRRFYTSASTVSKPNSAVHVYGFVLVLYHTKQGPQFPHNRHPYDTEDYNPNTELQGEVSHSIPSNRWWNLLLEQSYHHHKFRIHEFFQLDDAVRLAIGDYLVSLTFVNMECLLVSRLYP